MVGRIIDGRYAGASIGKLPDKNILFVQTEDGGKVTITKSNTISVDDVTEQYPSGAKKTIMVLWNNFETSIIQLGITEQPQPTVTPHIEKVTPPSDSRREHSDYAHTEAKSRKVTTNTKPKQNWLPIIIASCVPTIVLLLVFSICLYTGVLQFSSQQNVTIEQPSSNQQMPSQTPAVQSKPVQQAPKFDTMIEYDSLDYTQFSQYWYDGVFKCGVDFLPGEYYILPLHSGGNLYSVSDSPNTFPSTFYENWQLINKATFREGQFVKIEYCALMVPAEEVDTNNWWKYGVYEVGKDIPAGDYRIESISEEYHSELMHTGSTGAYQICDNSAENKPVVYELILQSQMYVTLKEGQYLGIVNAKLTPA